MEHLNALPVGTRLGEYEIEAVLGAGGFGITYRTVDVTLNKVVAIKEYLPRDFATRTNTRTVEPTSSADRADYEWGLARFVDEARTLARFNHPRVNQVHRFFEANGTAYMVLEYIEGETLSRVLEREGRLGEPTVFRLLADVLSGLEEVHGAGYVHRDLKPGNLMVQPDGSTIILDFGAARQAVGQRSKNVTSILTPGYAPIEQYDTKAEDVGPWSDIYALGMVAYRCISGLRDGDLPDAVTRSRATRRGSGDLEPAASLGQGRYDVRLLRAIDWAIQVEENERPQNLAVWRQALPVLASPQGEAKPATSPPVRIDTAPGSARWATVAGVVALLVAVVGGAYWYVRQAEPPVQQTREPVPEPRQAVSAVPTPQGSRQKILSQLNAQMVRIEGGTFTMGCTSEQEYCSDSEKPAHRVQVSSFELSQYEVTQELWTAIMGGNPSRFKNCPRCPVERVSWDDVQAFLRKLNVGGGRYRLPSEAEWEYAARGGAQSRGYQYAGSNTLDAVAWYEENSNDRTYPVGQKQANELGLYDMSGNVAEWVQDCLNDNYWGAPRDGRAWEQGDCNRRVLRGGSWYVNPRSLRSANRDWTPAGYRISYIIGFRIARSLP